MPSKRMRLELAKAQSWKCCWCGDQCHNHNVIDAKLATVEHIIPKSRGGTDSRWNLAMACHECNSVRGNDTNRSIGDIVGETVDPSMFKNGNYKSSNAPIRSNSKRAMKRPKIIRRYIKKAKEMNENGWLSKNGTLWDKRKWFETLRLGYEEDRKIVHDAVFNEIYAEV